MGRFREESPQLEAVEGYPLETFDKKLARVRCLTGDRWGNHESVAYLAEANVFVIFVLTSRSGVEFRESVPVFKALLKSYEFVTATPEDATDHFSVIKALAKDAAATPDGARYDKEHGRSFAQQHGAALRKCFETTPKRIHPISTSSSSLKPTLPSAFEGASREPSAPSGAMRRFAPPSPGSRDDPTDASWRIARAPQRLCLASSPAELRAPAITSA